MSIKFSKGALVWVRHPREAWKPGTVGEILSKDRVKIFYADGREEDVWISANDPLLRTISCEGDIQLSDGAESLENIEEESFSDDLTKMTQLITPAVLHSLNKSYENGRFYSKLGSGTVLALNPFKEVPELFTLKAIQSYHSVSLTELQGLPAHVYAAAQSALVSLRASVGQVNQSIIVSGESGAGKTWTVRCLMRYLAEVGIEYKRRMSSEDSMSSPLKANHVTPIRASMKHTIHDVCHTHGKSPKRNLPHGVDQPSERGDQIQVESMTDAKNITDKDEHRVAVTNDGRRGSEPLSSWDELSEDNFNLNVNNNKETELVAAEDESPNPELKRADENLALVLDFDEGGSTEEEEELIEQEEEDDVLVDMEETVQDLNTSIQIVDRIERRILHSNPILEAFGNAHTLRNENSSRFGKYIQLQYDRSGTIVGAQLRTYLLEKTRAVRHDPGEKSYHIFYQMLHGATEEERTAWRLPECPFPEDDGDRSGEFQKEKSDFRETRTSMLRIGILDETQRQIFKLLSAVLHLRQLTFEGSDDLQNPCTLGEENPQNEESLKTAAELLGVDEETIMKVITFREITAHSNRRRSVFHRPSTVEECYSRRDSLAKLMYEILFHWIVQRVGDSVCAPREKWCSFIGLLDVYGFESFENNSLEQLCINYANEKLQQHFVSSFLREQQEEYTMEGVSWTQCDLTDNVECLLALEAPRNGLFSLLNEECRLNRARAGSQLKSRVESMFKQSKYVIQPRISAQAPSFSVVHYAGQVSYRTEDLIEKNKDEVPLEITQLLATSRNQFVFDLANDRPTNGDMNEVFTTEQDGPVMMQNKGKHRPTVLTRFKKSLDDLLDTLASTDCHYIRCIKPNKQSLPDVFDAQFVLSQLEACGVVETIRVCAPAHPNKLSYNEFVGRYGFLLRRDDGPPQPAQDTPKESSKKKRRRSMTNVDLRKDACVRILKALRYCSGNQKETDKEPLQYGRTKIFLSSGLFEALELSRSEEVVKCAVIVQRTWRAYVRREKCRAERKAIIAKREMATSIIQRAWRYTINRRTCRAECKLLIAKRNGSATLIQRCWVNHRRRSQARIQRKAMIEERKEAATRIQSGQNESQNFRVRSIRGQEDEEECSLNDEIVGRSQHELYKLGLPPAFRGWRIRYKFKDLLDAWKQLKLLPEPEYRRMVQRRLRLLVGPEPALSPSPSYEAIRATFEMPRVQEKPDYHLTPPRGDTLAPPGAGALTPPGGHKASTKEMNSNAEKLTVYYDNATSKKIIVTENVLQDDLEPFENDLHGLLLLPGTNSPVHDIHRSSISGTPDQNSRFSPGPSGSSNHDSFTSEGILPKRDNTHPTMTKMKFENTPVERPLRSSRKLVRHAKIVRSLSSLDRVAEKLKVQRSASLPRFPQGPGIIYVWHNRAAISMMTSKRPLSLSSDPLTMIEMQYNETSSVLTTPFHSLLLAKRSRHKRSKHRHSDKYDQLTPLRPQTSPYGHSQSPRPTNSIPKSGSNCILKYADLPPKHGDH